MSFLRNLLKGSTPASVGVQPDGKLSVCDTSRSNCVCSQHRASESHLGPHYVQPFRFEGDGAEAMTRVLAMLLANETCEVVTSGGKYIHAQFATDLGTTDDVEFLLVPAEHVIHVRSASRLPVPDLGSNRARVGDLRDAFNAEDVEEGMMIDVFGQTIPKA